MGNAGLPADGIVERGTPIEVKCSCGVTFITQQGMVTIKGRHTPDTECPKCRAETQRAAFASALGLEEKIIAQHSQNHP